MAVSNDLDFVLAVITKCYGRDIWNLFFFRYFCLNKIKSVKKC